MQLQDLLSQMGGLQQMARELGVNESQAANGAAALLPAILGGFKKQAQAQPTGLEGLAGVLGSLGGGGLLDNVLSPEPTDVGLGNQVLSQIFGSKDVSRAVAASAATQSGVDASILKQMLPMLAMAVAGFMAKQGGTASTSASGGGLGDLIGGMLGGSQNRATRGGGGGLGSILDMNGDGNALDDVLRLAGKMLR
ncbi:MAG: DUF937 domain-containing protein [Vicinamibacterales bacterium]